MSLRSHQQEMLVLAERIAAGADDVRDILADVTPGGGKSMLPVICAARLLGPDRPIRQILWIVPRDNLRAQAEEAFLDPRWRRFLGHALTIRAAGNEADPARGLAGWCTTYQAIAANPAPHLAAVKAKPTLVVVDEAHHLPEDPWNEHGAWTKAVAPILAAARLRLFMTGTLLRDDRRRILGLPVDLFGRIDHRRPGFAAISYGRRKALEERAILPVCFTRADAAARWIALDGKAREVETLVGAGDDTRPALFSALRTQYAAALLESAVRLCGRIRMQRRRDRGLDPHAIAPGLGKLLVAAPDQRTARRYAALLERWLPPQAATGSRVALAISDEPSSLDALQRFRSADPASPPVLVTVAMASEGLDAPEIAVLAALTHVRSAPWLTQLVARATRIDPHAGPYEAQVAHVLHPDDDLFRKFRGLAEAEQLAVFGVPQPPRPDDERREGMAAARAAAVIPLASRVTALKGENGPPPIDPPRDDALVTMPPPRALPPSVREKQLRRAITAAVRRQAAAHARLTGAATPDFHAFNATLAKVQGKGVSRMTLPELEETLVWLAEHRIADFLPLLANDHRFHWSRRARNG